MTHRTPTPDELALGAAASLSGFTVFYGKEPNTYDLAAIDLVQYTGTLAECRRFVRKARAVALASRPR